MGNGKDSCFLFQTDFIVWGGPSSLCRLVSCHHIGLAAQLMFEGTHSSFTGHHSVFRQLVMLEHPSKICGYLRSPSEVA